MTEETNPNVKLEQADVDSAFEDKREKAQKHLLEQLYIAVQNIQEKPSQWEQKYEVFIPMQSIPDEKEHIREFNDRIVPLRNNKEWGTHVTRKKLAKRFPGNNVIEGVEYLFTFASDTQFEPLLSYLDEQIHIIKENR